MRKRRLAFAMAGPVCSGANSYLADAIIASRASNYECVGILEGFSSLSDSTPELRSAPLKVERTESIRFAPGVAIGTSDASLILEGNSLALAERAVTKLQVLGVECFVCLGGEACLPSLTLLGQAARAKRVPLQILHVPTVFENDLPRPKSSRVLGKSSAAAMIAQQASRLKLSANNAVHVAVVPEERSGFLAMEAAKHYKNGSGNSYPFVYIPEIFPRIITKAQFRTVLRNTGHITAPSGNLFLVSSGVWNMFDDEFQQFLVPPGSGRSFAAAFAAFVSDTFDLEVTSNDLKRSELGLAPTSRGETDLAARLAQGTIDALKAGASEISLYEVLADMRFSIVADAFDLNVCPELRLRHSVEIHDPSYILEGTRWRLSNMSEWSGS